MASYIKLHRKLLNWGWFNKPEILSVFIYCLIRANYEDGEYQGHKILRGQFITSPDKIAQATGLTYQCVRTVLTKLISTNEINKQTTNKYTIITICNYDSYQGLEFETNKQNENKLTNNQQTTNKQLTTSKNNKEVKEEKNKENANKLAARSTEFQKSLIPFIGTYKNEMLRKFADYWTESNPSKTKMKFELEKTWDTTKRLKKWADNETKFTKTTNETATEQTAGYKPIKFGTDK